MLIFFRLFFSLSHTASKNNCRDPRICLPIYGRRTPGAHSRNLVRVCTRAHAKAQQHNCVRGGVVGEIKTFWHRKVLPVCGSGIRSCLKRVCYPSPCGRSDLTGPALWARRQTSPPHEPPPSPHRSTRTSKDNRKRGPQVVFYFTRQMNIECCAADNSTSSPPPTRLLHLPEHILEQTDPMIYQGNKQKRLLTCWGVQAIFTVL